VPDDTLLLHRLIRFQSELIVVFRQVFTARIEFNNSS